MLLAALAAASIVGARPVSISDPQRQALVVRAEGSVIVRFDGDGFVQARACDGRLRPVGAVSDLPVRLRIGKAGAIEGLVYDPDLTAEQRAVFEHIMLSVGYSDWPQLADSCLP